MTPIPIATTKLADPVTVSRTPARKPVEATSDPNSIDLLARMSNRNTPVLGAANRKGRWVLQDGALSSIGTNDDIFRLPIRGLPSEYRIEMNITRLKSRPGRTDFWLCLMLGENRCIVILDGWGGATSGISWIDGKTADENETTHHGRVLLPQQPTKVIVTVNRGHIRVSGDGRQVIDWRGNITRLSINDDDIGGGSLLIASFGSEFRVDKLTLTSLDGPITKAQP